MADTTVKKLNGAKFDFQLTDADMTALAQLNGRAEGELDSLIHVEI